MLLVTGSHRSGTTWVGQMLCLSGEAGYIHEPFHPSLRQSWMRRRPPRLYPYVTDGTDGAFRDEIERIARFRYPVLARLVEVRRPKDVRDLAATLRQAAAYRREQREPLIKDPMALFAAPWFASRFGARPIVVARHPLGVVQSVLRLGWVVEPTSWLDDPLLCRDLIGPWVDDIRALAPDADIVERAAVAWTVMHGVMARYRAEHPDWYFVRHEDLEADPVGGFASLYASLGMTLDAASADRIAEWALRTADRRSALSSAQVARVRELTERVSPEFYDDASWVE